MTNLIPMYDNIIVKPVEPEEKTSSGLYIANPEISQEYSEGVVVAIGEGYKVTGTTQLCPLKVKVGDRVIYRKSVEVLVEDNGEDYLLLSEAVVLAIKR